MIPHWLDRQHADYNLEKMVSKGYKLSLRTKLFAAQIRVKSL